MGWWLYFVLAEKLVILQVSQVVEGPLSLSRVACDLL